MSIKCDLFPAALLLDYPSRASSVGRQVAAVLPKSNSRSDFSGSMNLALGVFVVNAVNGAMFVMKLRNL